MSKMADLIIDIQEMALDLEDEFGFETATVEAIAEHFQIPCYMVEEALAYTEEECEHE